MQRLRCSTGCQAAAPACTARKPFWAGALGARCRRPSNRHQATAMTNTKTSKVSLVSHLPSTEQCSSSTAHSHPTGEVLVAVAVGTSHGTATKAMPSTTTDRQDLQLSVAQRLQTIFDMPAADCSSDAPAPPNPSSSSSSSQESFFTQVWMTQQELQQLASSQPHSNAACGTTALRRCCIATWHPEQTLPYEWWQPAATLQASDLSQAAAASSGYPSASSSAARHVHSSRSSVAGVDVVSGDGSSQRCFLLDPLCSGGVLLEASQDFAGAGAAAALAAERDEAYVAMRAMQYEHWQQRQEYQHQLALLSRCIRQLEQQQDEQAGTPASRTLSRKTTSSRSSSQHSHSSSSSSSSRSKATSRRCTVQFSIACPTEFGQRLWLVGDAAALGSWDVVHGLRLNWVDGGKWVGSVDLDADCTAAIRYKAVLQCGPGQYRWAAGDNHELLLTAGSHSVEHEFA